MADRLREEVCDRMLPLLRKGWVRRQAVAGSLAKLVAKDRDADMAAGVFGG